MIKSKVKYFLWIVSNFILNRSYFNISLRQKGFDRQNLSTGAGDNTKKQKENPNAAFFITCGGFLE